MHPGKDFLKVQGAIPPSAALGAAGRMHRRQAKERPRQTRPSPRPVRPLFYQATPAPAPEDAASVSSTPTPPQQWHRVLSTNGTWQWPNQNANGTGFSAPLFAARHRLADITAALRTTHAAAELARARTTAAADGTSDGDSPPSRSRSPPPEHRSPSRRKPSRRGETAASHSCVVGGGGKGENHQEVGNHVEFEFQSDMVQLTGFVIPVLA